MLTDSNLFVRNGNTVNSTYANTLDGVGNRTRTDLNEPMMPSYNAETINYTYTLGNILASADGAAYTHDANGNRTTKSTSAGTTTYTYDSLNRLVQVAKGPQTTQYIYNGLGQRVGRIDNGVQTNYLVDPNGILPQVLAEMDASNNLISFYVYDGAGLVAKISSQNQYYFYHYDGLGSTVAITDSNANVVNSYCYSPEGLVGVQETIPNPFSYVGRFGVIAEGNGLYFMRARYYDPEVGRFINKDPMGYAGGMNLFRYVGNNQLNRIDPFGWGPFKMTVVDTGGRKGPTYGGTLVVVGNNGQVVIVNASNWPNPNNANPGITSGTYNSTYSTTGLHGTDPAVILTGDIPTLGPNPNYDPEPNAALANYIEVHCGKTPQNRGSAGCITIQPDQCQQVWDVLQEGSTGKVTVSRSPIMKIWIMIRGFF